MRFVSYMTPGFPEPMFAAIAAIIGAELHVRSDRSGPAPDEDPFADGTFDLGWICSTSYVDLALRSDSPSVELAGVAWVPDDPDVDGRPAYFGDLLTQPTSSARSLSDLRGKRIGCNDPVSLSGHYALRFAIEALGEDPDSFAELVFTGGHHRSLDALVAGEIDAAVIDSVVRTARRREDAGVADLRVIDRLGPWPVQPLVVAATMPDTQRQLIRDQLLEANSDHVLTALLHQAGLERLVEVETGHYEPIRRAMAGRAGRSSAF